MNNQASCSRTKWSLKLPNHNFINNMEQNRKTNKKRELQIEA